jgi:hypothetical protein
MRKRKGGRERKGEGKEEEDFFLSRFFSCFFERFFLGARTLPK